MITGARFNGINRQGGEVSLGVAYNHHCRNTLALYRVQAFDAHDLLFHFDEAFDGQGGMEDLAYKLLLKGLSDCQVIENVVTVPLLVHAHRTPEQQAEYETTMERGIKVAEERAKSLISATQ